MEVHYNRLGLSEAGGISAGQKQGILHYKNLFKDGNLVRQEKVNEKGVLLESQVLEHAKRGTKHLFYRPDSTLTNVAYDIAGERVLFDSEGNVVLPAKETDQSTKGVVLPTVRLHDFGDLQKLEKYNGKPVHAELSKKRDLFDPSVWKYARQSGVNFPLVHGPDTDIFHQDFEYTIAWIRGMLGCRHITLHPTRGSFQDAESHFSEKGEALKQLGVNLSYENLDADGRWLTLPEEIGALNIPYVSLTLDLSHLPLGTDLVTLGERVFPFLSVVHLSNRSGSQKDLPYRDGDMNVSAFLEMLRGNSFTGFIVPQYQTIFEDQQREDTRRLEDYFS